MAPPNQPAVTPMTRPKGVLMKATKVDGIYTELAPLFDIGKTVTRQQIVGNLWAAYTF